MMELQVILLSYFYLFVFSKLSIINMYYFIRVNKFPLWTYRGAID